VEKRLRASNVGTGTNTGSHFDMVGAEKTRWETALLAGGPPNASQNFERTVLALSLSDLRRFSNPPEHFGYDLPSLFAGSTLSIHSLHFRIAEQRMVIAL